MGDEFIVQYGKTRVPVKFDSRDGFQITTRQGVQTVKPGSVIKLKEAEAKALLAIVNADKLPRLSSNDLPAAKRNGEHMYNRALQGTGYQIGSVMTDYGDYERINYTNNGVFINMTQGGQKVDDEHGNTNLFLGVQFYHK